MPVKIATSKVDHHGRSQIPTQVRKYLHIEKDGYMAFWVVAERIVIDKNGTGTPNPWELKAGYRPVM